jgi:cyclohexyl-isocyanide hydratase
MTLHIGMLLFPNLTQLDLTGPYEIFTRVPDAKVHTVWKTTDPIESDSGLGFVPSSTLEACPPLDLLFIPGGGGQVKVMTDEGVMRWVRDQGERARFVTSVCTGSLVLGAAGLLKGYKATSHWAYRHLLPIFGAEIAEGRVVTDRNRITAGGVTAGIDFGLTILASIAGEDRAKAVQLAIEYDPAPPFGCGHPDRAEKHIVNSVREAIEKSIAERESLVRSL